MDCNDPDSEAFKSNVHAIFRARESGKTAALVSNLCPNTSDPLLANLWSRDDAQLDCHCSTSSHGQSDSDNSPDDQETSTEWKFNGHLYFAAGRWPAGKTYEATVWAAVE